MCGVRTECACVRELCAVSALAPRLCGLLGFLDNEKILESRATNLNTLKPYSIGTDNHLTARHALSKRPA